MVFSSFTFLFVFLPALLVCYFLLPSRLRQGRNFILLLFSLAFYACGGGRFLLLMLASIAINYIGGLLAACGDPRLKKSGLWVAVFLNLALLCYFKYAGFLVATINQFGTMLPVPEIVLPIGISFFTFQGLSYIIDVSRGTAACQRNPLKLALYIALFPQLVAGPIVRYNAVAEAIDRRRETLSEVAGGLVRFSFGLAKKMLLANALGSVADGIFGANVNSVSLTTAWLGALCYAGQIYFDFSGYSDMAIGLGRVFGFHFPENFNYPYISRSVTEFWRRWHISLSSWFRDYVYIPLGGSREGAKKQIRNILIVWLLTGLWHGAAWHFVFWGLWYGLWLMGEKFLWQRWLKKGPAVLHWLYTLIIVLVGWVFFRADHLSEALVLIQTMFGFGVSFTDSQTTYYLLEYLPEILIGIVACLPIKNWLEQRISPHSLLGHRGPQVLAVVLFVLSYYALVTGTFNPFIYFRF